MKYFSIFWSFVFVLFALVQLNDPDPYLWVPIYLFSTWSAFRAFRGIYDLWYLSVLVLFYLIGAIYLFPASIHNWIHAEEQAKSLEMKMPFIEEARESMGLMVCCLVNFGYLIIGFRKTRVDGNVDLKS